MNGIEISNDVTKMVRGWLHLSTDQSIKLPSPPDMTQRDERVGLGAEHLPTVKKKSERERLRLKIRKMILKTKQKKVSLAQEEELAATGHGSHGDQCLDSETSRGGSIATRKKPLAQTIDTRPFKKRRRKKSRAKKNGFTH